MSACDGSQSCFRLSHSSADNGTPLPLDDEPFRTGTKGAWAAEVSGFNVHAGGGLSDSPRVADALDLFVTPDRVTDMVRATLQTYCDLGDFEHKAVNRFRVLVHQLGPERITEELRGRLPYEVPGAGESLWTGEFEDHLGVREDGHGSHVVGLCIPMGRLTDEGWFEVARLARTHGDGGVRLSQRQNLLLTGSEFFRGGMSGLVLVKGAHDQTGDFCRHRRAAMVNLLDGLEDFRRRRAAHEQVAAGAGFERLQYLSALIIDR